MPARHLKSALLTATVLAAGAVSAFALDGEDFARTLNAAYASSGGKVVYSKAEVNGDTVILHDATLQFAGEPAAPATDLTFTGVEEDGDGGYTAETMTMPDIDYRKDGNTVSVNDFVIAVIEIPGPPAPGEAPPMLLFRSASTGPIEVDNKDGEIFAASGVVSELDRMDDEAGYETSLQANGLTFHLDRMKDAKTRAALEAMGYQTVTGTLSMKGSWESDDGHVSLSQLVLDLDDVGKLGMTFDLTGYTAAFVEAMRDLQEKAAANPDDEQAQQALGIGMLGLMQQLSFGGASIRFDDHSVTNKVLAYLGKQQGVSAEQMATAAKVMLPLALARLKNPEFQQEISDAVGTFLDDPQSLTVEAKPDKPVPFPMIMGAAMAAPETLPGVLSVTVTANQ
jgi:hypothetical protein